jgi:hypothetical protein
VIADAEDQPWGVCGKAMLVYTELGLENLAEKEEVVENVVELVRMAHLVRCAEDMEELLRQDVGVGVLESELALALELEEGQASDGITSAYQE